jgi:arginase
MYTLAAYSGMAKGPDALRKSGLASAFGKPFDAGDVALPPLKKDLVEGSTKNLKHFIDCTTSVLDGTKALDSEFVVLIGGECSMTPGALAGLTESFEGKPGMLWLDAHGDYNTPETSPSGYIGGMCLAMACGRGPELGPEMERRRPLLAEERLVHIGARALDQPEVLAFNSSPAKLLTAQQVKKRGAEDVGKEAARHLSHRSDWVVCHLDVDVVDPGSIPAVNYPTPGGLSIDHTASILRAISKTGKLRVLEVAAYNPTGDNGGSSGRAIFNLLRSVFNEQFD